MIKNKTDSQIIYSELYAILNVMDSKDVNKIPKKFMEKIKQERSNTYSPQYDNALPLNKQEIRKETLAILALLYINYWCKDENEKKEYLKLIEESMKQVEEKSTEKKETETIEPEI